MSLGFRLRLQTMMQATRLVVLPSITPEVTVYGGKQAKADGYADLLRSCGSLSDGRRLHARIVEDELYSVSYLRKQIVQMYLKFGSLENAALVFYEVSSTDIVTWTRLVGAYTQKGLYKQAIQVFQFMQLGGIKPDAVSFLPLLDACAGLGQGAEAKMVDSFISEAGMEENLVIKNSLVNMYGKCGMDTEAWRVFQGIHQRDVVSWTSILSACAQCGDSAGAVELFHSMQQEGVRPNRIAFVAVTNACNSPAALEEARKIHSSIRDSGCELEQTVGNAVINMYVKCGDAAAALEIFSRMPEHDVISWTSLASAYSQQQMLKEVLLVVQRMQLAGVKPNKVTFVTLLNACESPSAQAVAKRIHASVVEAGFESDTMVGNAVVNMYGKCGNLEEARLVFERLPRRDVITWNALISAYARRSYDSEPLLLFKRMEAEQVVPNKVTFVTVLYACGRIKALEEGRSVHGRLVEAGLAGDVVAGTAVVNMYAKCGCLEEARRNFEIVPKQDAAAWNVMISAYVEQGMMGEALELFQRMEDEGMDANQGTYISILGGCTSTETLEAGRHLHSLIRKRKLEASNLVIGTALLDMYVKLGNLEEAENVFTMMERHDVVSWTTMVVAYAQSGHVKKALVVFRRMQLEGVVPDRVALEIVLCACSRQEFLAAGKLIHYSIRGSWAETETGILNTVVNLYGKCSCLTEARLVFDSIHPKDRETWTAMVAAYSREGDYAQVMELFQQLLDEGEQGPVEASRVVLVSVVSACGHLDEAVQGARAHSLVRQAGLQCDAVVGTALVTMYGKLGNLEEALAAFEEARRGARLSELVEPKEDLILWTAMVAAYAHNGRGDESVELFFRLQQEGLEPDEVVFTAVLTACSGVGLGEQGICFFASMAMDYGIQANKQHITCMADLLGRSGRLPEAEALLELANTDDEDEHDDTLWTSLVGSCRMHADLERGERLAELWMRSQPKSSSAYVVLAGIHKSRSLSSRAEVHCA